MTTQHLQPIGKAFIVYGTVKAVSAAGIERILTPNSVVYANERIVTGTDGSISITLAANNGHLELGRMSDVLMDEDIYGGHGGQGAGHEGATDTVAQVADIQAALQNNENFDPTTDLPATAAGAGVAVAGGGAAGGGRHIVVFDSDHLHTTPDSGAETRGITHNFLDPPPGALPLAAAIISTPPVANPDNNTVVEGGSLTVDATHGLLGNDTSSTTAPLHVVAGTFTGSSGGILVLAADGSYHYTAPATVANPLVNGVNQPVAETFTYTIHDANGLTSSSTLTINVTDTIPQAVDHTGSFAEGSGLHAVDAAHGVLVGDIASADGISAVPGTFTGTAGGSLVLAADGSYHYTAPANVANPLVNGVNQPVADTFTFNITDADGSTVASHLTINVTDTIPLISSVQNGALAHHADLSFTGDILAVPSADGIVEYHFDPANTVATNGLTYTFTPDNTHLVATDATHDTVFTVNVNTNGTYDFTLVKVGALPLGLDDQHYNFGVVAVDNDGSFSNVGTFTVSVAGLGHNNTITGTPSSDVMVVGPGNEHISNYQNVFGGEHDVVDISNLVANATRDNLAVGNDGAGHAKLTIMDSTAAHNTIANVTFDNLSSAQNTNLDSLLGHVEIHDKTHTVG